MLIDDLTTSIATQAAFDAVVRVRTSTGRSSLCQLMLVFIFCSELHIFSVFMLCLSNNADVYVWWQ